MCLKCVKSCPAEILVKENQKISGRKSAIKILDNNLCFECRACEVVCPVNAIRIMCTIKKTSSKSNSIMS
jgi:ferredoxin